MSSLRVGAFSQIKQIRPTQCHIPAIQVPRSGPAIVLLLDAVTG